MRSPSQPSGLTTPARNVTTTVANVIQMSLPMQFRIPAHASLRSAIALVAIASLSTACTKKDDTAGLEGGALIFSDDFEREEIGEDWSAEGDKWSIDDGELTVRGARNDALWLDVALPEQFRVEFDARGGSVEGDLKFEVLGDGETHESGYVGIFGGWGNSLNIIARLDEHGDDRLVGAEEMRVETGRTYRMAVARAGDGALRWYIDGDEFLVYRDAEPLLPEGGGHFAFNDWSAPVVFDNVAVYDLSAGESE